MANNLVVVEITDEPIRPARPYVKDGITKMIPGKQKAYIHQGSRYPLETELDVDDAKGPLRPGRYLLAGECFDLRGNKAGYVQIGFNSRNLELVPVEEAAAYLTGKPAAVRAA